MTVNYCCVISVCLTANAYVGQMLPDKHFPWPSAPCGCRKLFGLLHLPDARAGCCGPMAASRQPCRGTPRGTALSEDEAGWGA